MTGNCEFEGREFRPISHPVSADAKEEAIAMYHDAPAPTRCQECFNIRAYCTCAVMFTGEMISRAHHPTARPTVAGVTPEERDRLLDAYIERGVEEFERMLNDNG